MVIVGNIAGFFVVILERPYQTNRLLISLNVIQIVVDPLAILFIFLILKELDENELNNYQVKRFASFFMESQLAHLQSQPAPPQPPANKV